MTLGRLKLIGIAAPVLAVLGLELVRPFVLGHVPLYQRIVMDAVGVSAMILFALYIFRVVDRMQAELKHRNRELLALHEAGLDVAAELSLDVVLKKVVEQARSLVGAKYGALSVVERDGHIVEFITAGVTPDQRAAIGPPPVGHGLLGVVLREGHSLRLQDIQQHPMSVGFPPNHPPMKSLLAVPIPCKGPFLGNLYLTEKTGGGEFRPEDEETLGRFALQAGIAIDNAHLHSQAADLAVAQERLRISHEMHDGVAQVLGYVNTKVQAAEAYLKRDKPEEATAQLRELATAARQAYLDVRESIVGLRTLPGARQPMAEVLDEYFQRWQEMSGISTSLSIDPELRLKPTVELQVVRIVQEALTNVRKHSKATLAKVDIRRRNGSIVATISDDGIGFNVAAISRGELPRYGLMTMRERAEGVGATLRIDSTPGKGTTVTLELAAADALI